MNTNIKSEGASAATSRIPSTSAADISVDFDPPPEPQTEAVQFSEPSADKEVKGETGGGTEAAPYPVSPLSSPQSAKTVTAPPRAASVVATDVFRPAPSTNPVLPALKKLGLYREPIAPGEHAVRCPWAEEHGDAEPSHAIYREPSAARSAGAYNCPYDHQDRPNIGNLLDHLGVDATSARGKPRIRCVHGEIAAVTDAAEAVLAATGNFYQAEGQIVTVGTNVSGDLVAEMVTEQALTMALATAADWERFDGRTKGWSRSDPPARIVNGLLKAQRYAHLPQLDGFARQPYFSKESGKLISTSGYAPEARIYAAFDGKHHVPSNASRDVASAALAELKALLWEFPFASEHDRSAALCAILTAAVRASLPLAPAFNVTASMPGSGKSYLASLICSFATSGYPVNVGYPTTAEEASKAMLAILIGKPAAIFFDDMQTDWLPHSMMNRMLTSETVEERILGSSRTVRVSTNALVIGTGNNVVPVRDMCRRVVTISLRPQSETPATHSFEERPVEKVKADRARYVSLALTIVQAWLDAGSPQAAVPNVVTFEVWTDMCRQPLLWLGEEDPATSLIQQVQHDPDGDALGRLLSAWADEFGGRPTTVRKVLERSDALSGSALQDALLELPCSDGTTINAKKLGWFLRKCQHRIVSGLYLTQEQMPERTAWAVHSTNGPLDDPRDGVRRKVQTNAPDDVF